MKSFNIVAETAQFVNLVYSSITPQTIELVEQLFETLNEFTVVGTKQNNTRWHHCFTVYLHTGEVGGTTQWSQLCPPMLPSVSRDQYKDKCYFLLLFYCIQDYLREQPDNMKSFNIVAETTGFVALVYSNINPQNIELVIQLFETLNEFTVVCRSSVAPPLASYVFTVQHLHIKPV